MGREAWRKQLLAGNLGINWIDLLYLLKTNPQKCVLRNFKGLRHTFNPNAHLTFFVFCSHCCLGIYYLCYLLICLIFSLEVRDLVMKVQ